MEMLEETYDKFKKNILPKQYMYFIDHRQVLLLGEGSPQMNKFKQVSTDDHKMQVVSFAKLKGISLTL